MCKSFIIWCNHICQFLQSVTELLEPHSVSSCLFLDLKILSLGFAPIVSQFPVLDKGPPSILLWYLYKVGGRNQVSTWGYRVFPSTLVMDTSFSLCFWHLYWKTYGCSCMGLLPRFLLGSMGQHVCFAPCSVFVTQVVILPMVTFCSGLLCLFGGCLILLIHEHVTSVLNLRMFSLISSVFYNFHYTGFSRHKLGLFLGIFEAIINGIYFLSKCVARI